MAVVQETTKTEKTGKVDQSGPKSDPLEEKNWIGKLGKDTTADVGWLGSMLASGYDEQEAGSRYEDGNRPDPATSTNPLYTIQSSANRVMKAGQKVTYDLIQTGPAIQGVDTPVTTGWEVINDASTSQANLTGPSNKWSWSLKAAVPGVHTIHAWVQVGDNRTSMTYTQQVVSNDATYPVLEEGVAAAPLSTISDFIALVERIESAHGGLPWQDVATRIRKEYYPGIGGRYGGIKAAFTWDDLIDEQQDISPLQSPPTQAADIAALRNNQVVSTTGGSVDIGHVMTGVDAMNFPRVAGIFSLHDMSAAAAATWSGDVGSALVKWATGTSLSDDTDATRQKFYDAYMSMSDLLGDVDGINLADLSGLSASAPLSARLRAYYVDSVEKGAQRRYSSFCATSGFKVSKNKLESSARPYIRAQVLNFAKGFNVKGSLTDALLLSGEHPIDIEQTSIHRIETHVDWFVEAFIAQLEAGLSSEP